MALAVAARTRGEENGPRVRLNAQGDARRTDPFPQILAGPGQR
jgi:hypothetical protein